MEEQHTASLEYQHKYYQRKKCTIKAPYITKNTYFKGPLATEHQQDPRFWRCGLNRLNLRKYRPFRGLEIMYKKFFFISVNFTDFEFDVNFSIFFLLLPLSFDWKGKKIRMGREKLSILKGFFFRCSRACLHVRTSCKIIENLLSLKFSFFSSYTARERIESECLQWSELQLSDFFPQDCVKKI